MMKKPTRSIDANRAIIVGVTGGIACGKSTTSELLVAKGAVSIDLDKLGHRLLKRGSPVINELVRTFGLDVLEESGDVSRQKLGAIVFADRFARRQLDAIMHPTIRRQSRLEMKRLVAEDANRVLVIDVPLLFESDTQDTVDIIVVVTASAEVQRQRLLERSAAQNRPLTQLEAQARIDAQIPLCEKVKHGHFVLNNDGAIELLQNQVNQMWDELRRLKNLP